MVLLDPFSACRGGGCGSLSPADTVSPPTLFLQGRGWRSSTRGAGAGRTLQCTHRPGEEEDLPWERWWFWDSTSSFVPLLLETWSWGKALELLAKGQHSLRDVWTGNKLPSGVFLAGSGMWRLPALLS